MQKSKPDINLGQKPRQPQNILFALTGKRKDDRESVSWVVKLVLFFHVAAITSWVLPEPSTAVSTGTKLGTISDRILNVNSQYLKHSPVQLYVLSTGVWQSWDMFAPNPASVDIYPDALVTLKSGKVLNFSYPRMFDLSLIAKYQKERYRKFFEHANTDQYLYPAFAKRVAYLTQTDPSDPVVKVTLRRHWLQVPRPVTFGEYSKGLLNGLEKGQITKSVLLPPNPPMPPTYKQFSYYTYNAITGQGEAH